MHLLPQLAKGVSKSELDCQPLVRVRCVGFLQLHRYQPSLLLVAEGPKVSGDCKRRVFFHEHLQH